MPNTTQVTSLLHTLGMNSPVSDMLNSPTPNMPTFLSNLNPDGTLKAPFKLQAQPGITFQDIVSGNYNRNPLHNLENFATSGDNNPWVKAQLAAEEQAKGQAMGAATAGSQAATTAAEDTLAARGGLGTGAMENLARQGANNASTARQNVVGHDIAAKQAIEAQNTQNQLGVAENLPGQEVQSLQPLLQEQSLEQQLREEQQQYNTGVNQFNIQNAEQGLNAQNQFNLQNYANQIAGQAGKEQAWATANSGKK